MGSNAKYKDSVFDEFVGLSEVGVNIFDAVGTGMKMGSNAKYKDSVFDEFVGLSEVGVNIFDAVGTESRGVWSRERDENGVKRKI